MAERSVCIFLCCRMFQNDITNYRCLYL